MIRFVIPVMWTMVAEISVEANTLEEAKVKAINGSPPGHLPLNGTYLNDSFVVSDDAEMLERASLLSTEPIVVEAPTPPAWLQQYPDADPRCISTLVAWGRHAPNCSCAIRASVPGEVIKPSGR